MQFKVKRIFPNKIEDSMSDVGFSAEYINFGAQKHKFLNLKIYALKPEAATILKQTALSKGCDCAVHKEVLGCKIEKSDVILSGTEAQLRTIAKSLEYQQFSLAELAKEILKQLTISNLPQDVPKIMGILNVTPDSFSDGGKFSDTKAAIEHGLEMIKEGAEIIDIGAESTRPNSDPIDSNTEIERLSAVVKELANKGALISIDTRNAATARTMATLGANIINDVSGLTFDKTMAIAVKEKGLSVIIGHSRGTPKDMDNFCDYNNVVEEVYFELAQRVENAINGGISPDKIIIDPGFGFAKNIEQNFQLLNRIKEFKSLGFKVCAGVSRKRFLQTIDCETDETTALSSLYLADKADIIRVHNVQKTKAALDLFKAIRGF